MMVTSPDDIPIFNPTDTAVEVAQAASFMSLAGQ